MYSIGEWLTAQSRQCLKLGIEIETNLKAIYADLSSENRIQAVVRLEEDLTAAPIYCTRLLLACGPWTPIVYRTLFPFFLNRAPIYYQRWGLDCVQEPVPNHRKKRCLRFVPKADKMEFAARNDGHHLGLWPKELHCFSSTSRMKDDYDLMCFV